MGLKKPLFCSPNYAYCSIRSVLDGEMWCDNHMRYAPRNWEIPDIIKRSDKYVVKEKYMGGDDKYLGRECIIYQELGQGDVTVLFTDTNKFELQSFPKKCLKKQKRKRKKGVYDV